MMYAVKRARTLFRLRRDSKRFCSPFGRTSDRILRSLGDESLPTIRLRGD